MIDQFLLHNVGDIIDEYLFTGKPNEETGYFGTKIYEQVRDFRTLTLLSKEVHTKYNVEDVKEFIKEKDIKKEYMEDVNNPVKVTKTDGVKEFRLSENKIDLIPHEVKRHPDYKNKEYKLFRKTDLIDACFDRHGGLQGYVEYHRNTEKKLINSHHNQYQRIKYIWSIFKVMDLFTKDNVLHYDNDNLGCEVDLRNPQMKPILHYIQYGTQMGIRDIKVKEREEVKEKVIDWLFDELREIFYDHTYLLNLCKMCIEVPKPIDVFDNTNDNNKVHYDEVNIVYDMERLKKLFIFLPHLAHCRRIIHLERCTKEFESIPKETLTMISFLYNINFIRLTRARLLTCIWEEWEQDYMILSDTTYTKN